MPSRVCPFCHDRSHWSPVKDSVRGFFDPSEGMTLLQAAFTCDGCQRMSVVATAMLGAHSWVANNTSWADDANSPLGWFPETVGGKAFPDVPDHIAQAADEAYRCQSIGAHRAAGALARAVVEATAKEKGITQGKLGVKIAEMEKQHLVRPHVRVAADEVRHLGNDMAHGDFVEPVEAEEADEVLQLMSEVLDEVFQSPARVAARTAARLAKKAASAQQ